MGKDVDECAAPSKHSCVSDATCKDTFGSYICTCHSRFYVGDGRQDGSGCKLSPYIHKIIFTLLGIAITSYHIPMYKLVGVHRISVVKVVLVELHHLDLHGCFL